ncbi:HAD family phosphatase [uncultured Bacteroides sp.]|uniref:HAD family hydrolase n=1 Tax=uncultured Bacteroides sp. TaxID=162156 RepID=UPI00261DF2D3|nr:HAD family phosphatase [uncultured Bacteroides sp.]
MAETKSMAALFDFDGVVVDTETQYSVFWHKMGVDYLGMEDLEKRIKGQTLVYIYDTFFSGMNKEQQEITIALDRFEREMSFDFIPGVEAFVSDLRRNHVRVAVVTSSNNKKMEVVYRAKPEIRTMFDHILTAEMFTASKPAPDCFLLGMKVFGTTPETTYVFEDSFNGLKAGMASGATVVGLTTTNPRPEIAPLCHHVLNDFEGFTYDKLVGLHK